jgi:3-oxoacyl-[acyl-carrier protein] reductase
MALAREGVELVITARTAETWRRRGDDPPADRREGDGGAGDITTDAGRAAALAACPEPDILVNNAGGPPHGDFREWTATTGSRRSTATC